MKYKMISVGRGIFNSMLFDGSSYVTAVTSAGYAANVFIVEYEPIENEQPIMTMEEFDQVLLRFRYGKR